MIQSGFHDTLRAQEKLAKHLLMSLFLLGTQVDYISQPPLQSGVVM